MTRYAPSTRIYGGPVKGVTVDELQRKTDEIFRKHIEKCEEQEEHRRVCARLRKGMSGQTRRILHVVQAETAARGSPNWLDLPKRERAEIVKARALTMEYTEGMADLETLEKACRRFFEKYWPLVYPTS
jgi:hypothetical protein